MAITGNLRTMQLSELLQWLSMGQKTGTLAIRGGAGEKRIYFQNGRIISSSSTIEREYLGHFLVSYGYITEEELTKAMEVQEESKILLGKILVMIGAIAEEDLVELIRLKACETIYDIFLWPEGAFQFLDGEIPQRPMVPIAIDVTGIVMEGLRRFDEWQRIRGRIRSLRDVPTIVAPVDVESLAEPHRLILRAIDGVRSLGEIAEATHNSDFPVARLVFDLIESGHVELAPAPAVAAPKSSELTPEDPYETVFEEAATPHFEGVPDTADELPLPPPPQEGRTAPSKDFARFLKRGPDSGSHRARPAGPVTTSFAAPVAAPPAPPPSTSFRPSAAASAGPPTSGSLRIGAPSAASLLEVGAPPSNVPWPAPVSGAFRVPAPAAGPSSASLRAPAPQGPPSSVSLRPPASPPSSQNKLAVPASASGSTFAPTAIPSLTRPMEELMSWSFTPNEAFILSRINGLWDVRSIAKISPFPEGEVLRVFEKLHDGGLIRWR
ncbi:MAG TPA: DUF4388 domain-containing protein [Thermoanaerobaculia bacterium]|nr:DUF4388 domain-containing protein [Thermoanaerobaculia bacterium]